MEIEFYNCTIILNKVTYFNHINEIKHKYVIPSIRNDNNHYNICSFANFTLPKIKNTESIFEIHYKEPSIYFGTILSILNILFSIGLFVYFKCKSRPIHFVNSIQENFEDNERGVIFVSSPFPKHSLHDKISSSIQHFDITFVFLFLRVFPIDYDTLTFIDELTL